MTAEFLRTLLAGIAAPLRDRFVAIEARITALEARPALKDKGVWRHGVVYDAGDVVSHRGSAWICRGTHFATGDDLSHDHFRLLVKRGKDARDAR